MKIFDHASREENKVALTFDDGPNPFWTPKVLVLLDEFKIKGNFFVIGKWAEVQTELLKGIHQHGHLIGNHSYSHTRDNGDFQKAENIIMKIIGEDAKYARPPYLDGGLCAGYAPAKSGKAKIINADVFPHDYRHTAVEITDFVLQNTQNGSIILLHDGSTRESDLEQRPKEMFEALPEIIKKMQNRFKFARLDEMNFN